MSATRTLVALGGASRGRPRARMHRLVRPAQQPEPCQQRMRATTAEVREGAVQYHDVFVDRSCLKSPDLLQHDRGLTLAPPRHDINVFCVVRLQRSESCRP